MSLNSILSKGLEEFLRGENEKLVGRNERFTKIVEHHKKYGSERMSQLDGLDNDLKELIVTGARKEREDLTKDLNPLIAYLVLNNRNELYTPISENDRTNVESELSEYIHRTLIGIDDSLSRGTFGPFVAYRLNRGLKAGNPFEDPTVSIKESNIGIDLERISILNLHGNYPQAAFTEGDQNYPFIDLTCKPSWRDRGLISLTDGTRGFFPGYKIQFLMETNVKPFVLHLNSSSDGTRVGEDSGNYINHPEGNIVDSKFLSEAPDATSNRDGTLYRWFERNPKLQPDDQIRIYRINAERFRLEYPIQDE
jgi:hypothetical protein|tara:strand:- start:44 stop:970 length:927 start_codon:yes stop_codon:yes gene_type:complete